MYILRVLLADDNLQFLEAARNFLSSSPQTEVIGSALTAHESLEMVERLRPDLVLMDVRLPDGNGIEAMSSIKARPGSPRVIIMTLFDTPEYRAAAMAAHADGFISKSDLGTQLLTLIATLFPENANASTMT